MRHFINLLRRYRARLTRPERWLQLLVTPGLGAQPRLLMLSHTESPRPQHDFMWYNFLTLPPSAPAGAARSTAAVLGFSGLTVGPEEATSDQPKQGWLLSEPLQHLNLCLKTYCSS